MEQSQATSSQLVNLVNRSRPTNAPRRLHRALFRVGEPSAHTVTSRVLHSQPGVRESSSQFSRAWWTDCSIVFSPTVHAVGLAFVICIAAVPEDSIPTTPNEVKESPACRIFSFGQSECMPAAITYNVNFNDAGTNPLIKPAPIEERRTAVVVHIDVSRTDGEIFEADTNALLEVYLCGHIVCGGSE